VASRQEVLEFIQSAYPSVWAIELSSLLRQNRDRSLDSREMVSALRGSELVVSQSLKSLIAAGLVVIDEEGRAQYSPASSELDKAASDAEALYAKSPNAVRRAIVAAANPGIRAFANAFRLRDD
jgi:hypothetical protein